MKRTSILLMGLLFPLFMSGKSGSRVEFLTMPCQLLQGVSEREYAVYLPPSYEENPNRQYPILYLLHGGGENHTVWSRLGNLQVTCDSLIALGLTEERIIVCPEANKNYMVYFNADHWRYEDYFFRELIPYMESHYRVKADRDHRAVAGLSMGGGGTIVFAVHHPEMFYLAYGMSSYLKRQEMEWLRNDPTAEGRQQVVEANNPMKTIRQGLPAQIAAWKQVRWYVDCGDDDFTFEANMELVQVFRQQAIPYELRVKEGGHNWIYWRQSLIDLLKVL